MTGALVKDISPPVESQVSLQIGCWPPESLGPEGGGKRWGQAESELRACGPQGIARPGPLPSGESWELTCPWPHPYNEVSRLVTPACSDETADSPKEESKREKKGSGAPLKENRDTQQWHANPLGWWLGVGGMERLDRQQWNDVKKNSWQLFDVSAFWFRLSAALCKWQRLCQSGGICPTCGRVMGDYALMSSFCPGPHRGAVHRRVFDIHLMHLFISRFADSELETLWLLDRINSCWKEKSGYGWWLLAHFKSNSITHS